MKIFTIDYEGTFGVACIRARSSEEAMDKLNASTRFENTEDVRYDRWEPDCDVDRRELRELKGKEAAVAWRNMFGPLAKPEGGGVDTKKIIVTVSGGVADVHPLPEGVEVEIRDYDNGECADEGEYELDALGERYTAYAFRHVADAAKPTPKPTPTPKPWEISYGEDGAVIFGLDGGTIANVPIDLIVWKANARLIHAAPKLLAELEGLLDQLRGIGVPDWDGAEGLDLSQADAIIAEAKGK